DVDLPAVMERAARLRLELAGRPDPGRLREEPGVDLYAGSAWFMGEDWLQVDGRALRFARAVVTTGAAPVVPGVEGLAEAGYLTPRTLLGLPRLPARLAVLGGGPEGCELAQAFARLGSRVVLIDRRERLLGRLAPAASAVLSRALVRDG